MLETTGPNVLDHPRRLDASYDPDPRRKRANCVHRAERNRMRRYLYRCGVAGVLFGACVLSEGSRWRARRELHRDGMQLSEVPANMQQ